MNWLLARLDERSTWAAIGGVLSLFGWFVSPEGLDLFVQAGIAVGSLILFILKEKQREGKTVPNENVEG